MIVSFRWPENYTVQYFDENGKRRKAPTGTSDKATAERIAAKIESEVALRKRGHIDATQERLAKEARRKIDGTNAGCYCPRNGTGCGLPRWPARIGSG